MYEIKVNQSFSAAHNLKNYKGKCERLHGHNWNVEAVFRFKEVGDDGMAIDFHAAKGLLKEVTERLDHSYLNENEDTGGVNPTSENIAALIYRNIKDKNKNIYSVSVWESDNSCATYLEG